MGSPIHYAAFHVEGLGLLFFTASRTTGLVLRHLSVHSLFFSPSSSSSPPPPPLPLSLSLTPPQNDQANDNPLLIRIPCGLVSTWVVWVPATSLVYTLPSPLQIPLFNLVLCFFVLLLSFVSQTASAADASTSSYSQLDEEEDMPPQKA